MTLNYISVKPKKKFLSNDHINLKLSFRNKLKTLGINTAVSDNNDWRVND